MKAARFSTFGGPEVLEIVELVESGRFRLPEVQTFPLADVAQAHRFSENGHVRAKLVLTVDENT